MTTLIVLGVLAELWLWGTAFLLGTDLGDMIFFPSPRATRTRRSPAAAPRHRERTRSDHHRT